VAPNALDDGVARQDLAGAVHQKPQDLELPGREIQLPRTTPRLVRSGVEPQVPDFENHRSRYRTASGDGTNARQKLLEGEWFRQIIVGPGIEAGDDVPGRVPGGEHQDRGLTASFPQPSGHLPSVHGGDHQVEDDDVEPPQERELETLGSVSGDRRHVSVALETALQERRHALIVLDDQNVHGLNIMGHL